MYYIVNNVFLTTQKHVGHDCQVKGDFTSDIVAFTSDFVRCPALISSPDWFQLINGTPVF